MWKKPVSGDTCANRASRPVNPNWLFSENPAFKIQIASQKTAHRDKDTASIRITNYEYRIHGNYTGEKAYDPNSDQILPVFVPTNFELVNREPGWLFSPKDHYHPQRFTLWAR